MKRIGIIRQIVIICLILLLPLQSCTPAQAQGSLESRISRLESEVFGLRAQVAQLQSQPRRSGAGRQPSAPGASPGTAIPRPSADPMFDRLATLAIELKERLNAVEARLSKLEAQKR
jgi:hypothetical protein